jgi:hypothetical protein
MGKSSKDELCQLVEVCCREINPSHNATECEECEESKVRQNVELFIGTPMSAHDSQCEIRYSIDFDWT